MSIFAISVAAVAALIAYGLLLAIAGGVLGVTLAVVAPIVRMALRPAPLGLGLIVAIVAIGAPLGLLPQPPPRPLTRAGGAIALLRDVGIRYKRLR